MDQIEVRSEQNKNKRTGMTIDFEQQQLYSQVNEDAATSTYYSLQPNPRRRRQKFFFQLKIKLYFSITVQMLGYKYNPLKRGKSPK